jgi:hypothetical protein
MGARVLLYYWSIESQWFLDHQLPTRTRKISEIGRTIVLIFPLNFAVNHYFNLQGWKDNLDSLLAIVARP